MRQLSSSGRDGRPVPDPYQLVLLWAVVVLINIPTFALQKVFLARRLARRGRNEEAAALAREFIHEIETSPWKRFICRFAIEVSTNKPEVVGYLCLARAPRQADDAQAALSICQRAADIDPLCPTVQIGMAIAAAMLGDEVMARAYLQRARELGFSGSLSDRLFLAAGDATAELALLVPMKEK